MYSDTYLYPIGDDDWVFSKITNALDISIVDREEFRVFEVDELILTELIYLNPLIPVFTDGRGYYVVAKKGSEEEKMLEVLINGVV